MAAIHDLIAQVQDEALRSRLQQEIEKVEKTKKFGLVFEEHLPECTPLYDIPVQRGAKVALKAGSVSDFYEVLLTNDGKALCHKPGDTETVEFQIDDLVTIAEFGDSIYPYLKPIDTVCNAPDSDLWHTLIEADNYHALQLLEYLYGGQVDCIYIDPPYNTGARDWKYNNDYVDSNDSYRHSKWLSMMEKRLKIAKKLLNPKDSVLIVTIDEKEYAHLGCLLEELFAGQNIQMITSVINPSGSARKNMFSRAEEYIYFVFIGDAHVFPFETDMIHPPKEDLQVRWASLLRSGSNSNRSARPKLFYPVFFRKDNGRFFGVGDSLPINIAKESAPVPEGCFAVWPTKANNQDARWTLSQETLLDKLSKGYVKFGRWNKGDTVRTISYLADGMEQALLKGELEILGKDDEGALITGRSFKPVVPLSVWNMPSHGAGDFGSSLLLNIFKHKRFSFPKSLYAVEDTLRFIVKGKPNALIIDFFAGSGTTLHAVNLLNAEDGGNRRCILVTNNEVSNEEAKELTKKGFYPGDTEWEALGIARYVTWPRTVCSIKGIDIKGNPLRGDYISSKEKPMHMCDGFMANVVFFKLGFLDKTSVALGIQFKELLPVLWMKAGAIGSCPSIKGERADMLIFPGNRFAVLLKEDSFAHFAAELKEHPEIQTAFIITDYEANYRAMIKELQIKNTYQLYRDYLDNFRINHGRS